VLRELHVRNIAVVAAAAVELGPGLNALTGETGAGKSIVVDSLALLAGARASADLVRGGAETLTVTGVFEPAGDGWRRQLAEAGLDGSDELLVRREISVGGRNRVFVNDQPATVRLLADLAPELLRIHGQREELGLVAPDLQRQWLDASGGAEGEALTARVGEAHESWRRLAERLARLSGDAAVRRQRLELLRAQAREVDAAGLEAGEEEELRQERELLRHREALDRSLDGAFRLLFDDEEAAAPRAARARALLGEITAWEPRAAAWSAEIEELRIRLEEVARDVRGRLDDIAADPDRLNAVEDRLAVVERVCRRLGLAGSAEVLARRREIAAELEELEGDAGGREELEEAVAAALAAYREAAGELSRARGVWGEALARRMERELADLGLAQAQLAVRLTRRRRGDSPLSVDGEAVEFGAHGFDQVVFEFAANPGEEPRPLSRIASGGELSRLYLALQLAVGGERSAAAPTLVFDEVDAGVGGAQAAALGRKLQRLAAGGQVLVVTHLPQVASCADLHFKVTKSEREGRTFTGVERLAAEERVEEVARMLAGRKITELSRSHARELLAGSARRR
jgi:DNA repair protein RecN (Recombination protein N)